MQRETRDKVFEQTFVVHDAKSSIWVSNINCLCFRLQKLLGDDFELPNNPYKYWSFGNSKYELSYDQSKPEIILEFYDDFAAEHREKILRLFKDFKDFFLTLKQEGQRPELFFTTSNVASYEWIFDYLDNRMEMPVIYLLDEEPHMICDLESSYETKIKFRKLIEEEEEKKEYEQRIKFEKRRRAFEKRAIVPSVMFFGAWLIGGLFFSIETVIPFLLSAMMLYMTLLVELILKKSLTS